MSSFEIDYSWLVNRVKFPRTRRERFLDEVGRSQQVAEHDAEKFQVSQEPVI